VGWAVGWAESGGGHEGSQEDGESGRVHFGDCEVGEICVWMGMNRSL